MKSRFFAAASVLLVISAIRAAALEPGQFSFKAESGRFSIEANQALKWRR